MKIGRHGCRVGEYNTRLVSPPDHESHAATPTSLHASLAQKALAGFFLSGLLTSFLGAILPAWRHHIEPRYVVIGTYFLCQNLGVVIAASAAPQIVRRKGLGFALRLGCGVAVVALALLAAFGPPAPSGWRMAGLFVLGLSIGLLNTAVFFGIFPAYQIDRAGSINLAGTMFGLGCLVTAVLVAGTFFVYTVPSIIILAALIPGFALGLYARSRFPQTPPLPGVSWREALTEYKSPAAILFALFLFFQFGNEWAIAGWLPIFLTQRLGVSPGASLFVLALYWLSLLLGRVAAQWLLPRVSHARLLFGAVLAPMFGCLILSFTNNMFGAVTGVLFAGSGFAAIYPLAVEKISYRFPYYHPVLYNGIFSLALTGALLAPASLGYFAHFLGIGIVMTLPLLGSVMVFVLLLLILLEAKLSGSEA